MNHPQRNQKTPQEWHDTEPDWDQEAHEADLAAAKRRVGDYLDGMRGKGEFATSRNHGKKSYFGGGKV